MTNPNIQVTYIFQHDSITGKVEIVQTNLVPTFNQFKICKMKTILNNSETFKTHFYENTTIKKYSMNKTKSKLVKSIKSQDRSLCGFCYCQH